MAQGPATGAEQEARFRPSDEAARQTIENELGETLFVEASAGTGKTHSLVARTVNLVGEGVTTLDRIAAITFTEAAASELRHRIREKLEEEAETTEDEARRERCRQGITDLDQATIRTLHSFAGMLLHERPLEAGLPPGFDTTDEIAAGLRFDEAWEEWLDTALETDSSLAPHLSLALTLGLSLEQLKQVAQAFHENYTDMREAGFGTGPPPQGDAARTVLDQWPQAERLCKFSRLGEADQLFNHVRGKRGTLRRLSEAETGSVPSFRLLQRVLPLRQTRGRQADWETDPETGVNACKALKDLLDKLNATVLEEMENARRHSFTQILRGLRDFALEYAERRRAEGRAEFHDLLIWARDMLRDQVEVRDHFRRRFTHLLMDESQDTDPIQAEIAMFLAEDVAEGIKGSQRPTSWEGISPEMGKLFVVGDPKQSIYRFRRADVEQMRWMQERMEQAGGQTVSLVQNFRSQRPVTDWVNHLFVRWMGEGDPGDGAGYVQADYEAMTPRWQAATESPLGPRVWALSDEAVDAPINAVRQEEASDTATLLKQIVAQGWQVLDRDTTEESGRETYRDATYSDICILMPARTSLPALERALEARYVPYRLESASLVFETQEIRDLLNCLKAIDDPADQVATVAALRSVAFGCSDVDLFRHHEDGGRFDCLSVPPDGASDPVSEALSELRRFHQDRLWQSTAYLIDRFVRERRLMEAASGHPRMREQWRRYRFMVERAWQFAAAGGGSLRAFIQWVENQIAEGARVTESPVPESDEESVRVMTIHAAKGLEFPVVVLTGINSDRSSRGDTVLFDRRNGRVEAGVGPEQDRISTAGYEELKVREGLMSNAEDVRLMYVATTRARDHLVLSLRRSADGRGERTRAAAISRHLADSPHLWEPVTLEPIPLPQGSDRGLGDTHPAQTVAEHTVEAWEGWQKERKELVRALSRPSYAAATGLRKPGEEDKPEQEHVEPWRRGRAGTSVGRAVHAVLQSIDLATGDGLEERARAQAMAEGIPGREGEIARLARAAVESSIVRRAVASGRLWREVPVATPIGSGSLHGFIDLLFDEPDGLVVVDYKTDAVTAGEAPDAVARYRLQGGAYAHAVREVTGRPVKEVVFLYLQPQREVMLEDVAEAIWEAANAAEKLLAGGAG